MSGLIKIGEAPTLGDGKSRAHGALCSLWTSVVQGDPAGVERSLGQVSPNSRFGSEGRSMLHWACGAEDDRRKGLFSSAMGRQFAKENPERLRCLRLLMQAGAKVSSRDGRAATALHWAAKMDMPGACELLVRAGADMDARDATGATPLMWACASKLHAKFALAMPSLIALGAPLSSVDRHGRSAMHVAADGQPWDLKALFEAGGDLDLRDALGRTALHRACELNRMTAVAWLVELGADPLIRDSKGRLPMDMGQGVAPNWLRSSTEAAMIKGAIDCQAPSARRPGL